MKHLLALVLALPFNASAYSLLECSLFEGPTLIRTETTTVDANNQSMMSLGEMRGFTFTAYSLDHFVVIFAEKGPLRLNTTGNMASALAIYGEPGANDTLVVDCVLDPAVEEAL